MGEGVASSGLGTARGRAYVLPCAFSGSLNFPLMLTIANTESKFATATNFGDNLFSLYDPQDPSPIFQIDANFGYPAAVLVSALGTSKVMVSYL